MCECVVNTFIAAIFVSNQRVCSPCKQTKLVRHHKCNTLTTSMHRAEKLRMPLFASLSLFRNRVCRYAYSYLARS